MQKERPTANDRCRNRTAGEFGGSYLVVGFFLQAVGYLLQIGGVKSETSCCRAIAALALAFATLLATWGIWALFHERRTATLIGKVKAEHQAEVAKAEKDHES